MRIKQSILICFAIALALMTVGTAAAVTITVDDDRVENPSSDYTIIQDAVDAADNGDTIFVYPGEYTENVIVDKELTIMSESGDPVTTRVYADSLYHNVFHVNADNVIISGFYISNSLHDGISLYEVNNCIIMNNRVTGNGVSIYLYNSINNTLSDNYATGSLYGIVLEESGNNTLSANIASSNRGMGIYLDQSSDNELNDNTANSNRFYGIYLFDSSNNNTLTANSASTNDRGIILTSSNDNELNDNIASDNEYGIQLSDSGNNTLTNNTASSNNDDGIRLYLSGGNELSDNSASNNNFGIVLSSSTNNLLSTNTADLNNVYGIHLDQSSDNELNNNNVSTNADGVILHSSSNNTLNDNTVSNSNNGIWLRHSSNNNTLTNNTVESINIFGIHLDQSSDNELNDNTANSGNNIGIYVYLSSNNNTLSNNIVSNNNGAGIWLYSSSNNELENNYVSNNDYFGIYLEGSSNNNIYNNYFNNTNNAYDDGNNVWNITKTAGTNIMGGPYLGGNYWSDYTGVDTDGDGLGDTLLPYNSTGGIINGGDYLPLTEIEILPVYNIDSGKDFSTIQAAIDDSGTLYGHTILVNPGTYTENVNVTKELTIISQSGNPADTIVQAEDPDYYVFNVSVDNVTINGFNVSGATNVSGIWIIGVESCIVTNNILSNNHFGIVLESSIDIYLTNNAALDNDYGIVLVASSNNNLTSNAVSNNNYGIVLSISDNNHLINNTALDNEYGIGLQYCSNNIIYNNYLNNTYIIEDDETNIWNSTEMLTYIYNGSNYVNYIGNYYSDYSGPDSNDDGIGDTPYDIPDSSSDDNYPLMFWPVTIIPSNQPPVANANGPYVGNESTAITFNASASYDPDGTIVSSEWDLDDDGEFDDATGMTVTYTWDDDYTGNVSVKVTDDKGASDTDTTTVTVNNVAPTVTAVGDVINESEFATVSGTISDLGILDTFNVSIDWGDGYNETFIYPAESISFSESHQYLDDDPTATPSDDYVVKVTVIDDNYGEGNATTTVTVNNVAPVIYTLDLPAESVATGTTVNLNAQFSDPGTLDVHSYSIDWGDGSESDTLPIGVRVVDVNHTYTSSGLYNVTFSVDDDDLGNDAEFQSVLVYDPASGSVSGKGTFNSPAGAYVDEPGLTGVTTFDFISEYKKGVLTGETVFEFDDLNFYSADYEWMLIAGHKAIYKGNGTIDGEGDYEFLISAIDAERTSSVSTDMFRIKIWNTTGVIYDNNVGVGVDTGDFADPITPIPKGKIQIKP